MPGPSGEHVDLSTHECARAPPPPPRLVKCWAGGGEAQSSAAEGWRSLSGPPPALPAAPVRGPLGVWLQLVPLKGWAAVPAAPGAAGAAGAAHTQASNTPSLGSSWRMRERGREGGHARVSTRPRACVWAAAH